ncbi:DUF2784 domain-containing protein [Schlegelella sp. ID0723]|uniref:DUF2784 domain-containing protein n=1 Tax=Piscinibacter koreensis TaxID=2742824 RepID=A0A7Y6NLK4_9BURK|nr:DUF2784 domain-containing protein [Schlegelella koreensis]
MATPAVLGALADAVLVLHVAVAAFVVAGLPLVWAGNALGWRWVNGWRFRAAHLAAIGIVVAESWLGIACPLTTLENALRSAAGRAGYAGGFIEHWLGRVLFHDAPEWVFVLAYTTFGIAVLAAWLRYPPRRGGDGRRARPLATRRQA